MWQSEVVALIPGFRMGIPSPKFASSKADLHTSIPPRTRHQYLHITTILSILWFLNLLASEYKVTKVHNVTPFFLPSSWCNCNSNSLSSWNRKSWICKQCITMYCTSYLHMFWHYHMQYILCIDSNICLICTNLT